MGSARATTTKTPQRVCRVQVAAYPHDYQVQNAYANALALSGYDVVDGALKITGAHGSDLEQKQKQKKDGSQ
jgi:hypothetical protein